MKLKQATQTGFAALEVILVLVIVGVIAGTGYFVWHVKQNTDNSLRNAASSQPGVIKASKITDFAGCKAAAGSKILETYPEQCVTKDGQSFTEDKSTTNETAQWLLYELPGGGYTIRFADGWKLKRYPDNKYTNRIYTYVNDDLALKTGTKATVTDEMLGQGEETGFFIEYTTLEAGEKYGNGTKQTSLQTNEGLEIEKYYYIEQNEGEGILLAKGDRVYDYIVRKSPNRAIVAEYSFQPRQVDYHEIVEKVLQTAHFN